MDLQGYMSGAIRPIMAKGIRCDERSFTCKGSMGPLHSGHPNQQDLADLRAFIEKTIK